MGEGSSGPRICERCNYVLSPWETACPKCARAPVGPPAGSETVPERLDFRRREPVGRAGGQRPEGRLASLSSVIGSDATFAAMVLLLAIEALVELKYFNYTRRIVMHGWDGPYALLRYITVILFAGILCGILSLRWWGYVFAMLLTAIALAFDARAALITMALLVEIPGLGPYLARLAFQGSILGPLTFHTGIHVFALLALLRRGSYFDFSRRLRKEERRSQLMWLAGGVAVVSLCGCFLWGAYSAGGWPFRYANPDEIEVSVHGVVKRPTDWQDGRGTFGAIEYVCVVRNNSAYRAPVVVVDASWDGDSVTGSASETFHDLKPGQAESIENTIEAAGTIGESDLLTLDTSALQVRVLREGEQ